MIIKVVLLQRGERENTPDFCSAVKSLNPVTRRCLTGRRVDIQHIEAISKSQATTNSLVL